MAHEGQGGYRGTPPSSNIDRAPALPSIELDQLLHPFRVASRARRGVALCFAFFMLLMAGVFMLPSPVHAAGRCTERTVNHPTLALGSAALAAAGLAVWSNELRRARELEPEKLRAVWGQLTPHPRGWRFHDGTGRSYVVRPLWDRARYLPARRVIAWVHPRLGIAVLRYDQWLAWPPRPKDESLDRALDSFRASFR